MDIKNEIFNAMETIFSKVYRSPLNSEGLEKLRSACGKLVEAIRRVADTAAIERCQKLNDATKDGFTKTSEALQAEYDERTETDKALDERLRKVEKALQQAWKTSLSHTEKNEHLDDGSTNDLGNK